MKKAAIASIGILILLFFTACSFSTASYSSDDLIGTWSGWSSTSYVTYVFKSNAKVTFQVQGETDTDSGTWYLSGAILTIYWSDSSEDVFIITFSNDYETLTMMPSTGGTSMTLTKQ